MDNCPKCGLPVKEGAKFCAACGTRMPQQLINNIICSVCGNSVSAGAKFCNVCGTAVPESEQQSTKPETEDSNPEMESIEVPELHFDDAPVKPQSIPPTTPDMPTMDSIYLPGQEPAASAPAKKPEAPTAEEIAMASRTVSVQDTPTVSDTVYAGAAAATQAASKVLTPEGYQTVGSQGVIPPQGQPNRPVQPQNAQYNQYNQQINSGITPGKGAGALVPIILIILILAVICVDVFWLFRDQIFGDKDDSSENCAVVTLIDEELL